MRIIQIQPSAPLWILLCFLILLNKCIFVRPKEFQIERPTFRQTHFYRMWSEWSSWSACSRTCGGGVRMRTRVCKIRLVSSAASANTCLGETTEYEICSRHNCSPHAEEFLDYQCSQRNGQIVGGRKIEEWIPHHYGKNPCELQCWAKDRSLLYSFGKIIDGTKCASTDPTQPALCVNGRCTPVDCAGYIGTDNRLDNCGVCRGNNSTCIKYRNVFWGRPRSKTGFEVSKDYHYDYNEIASIPLGATHILVTEGSGTNFLALMDHKGNYHINGNWRIQSPGHFFVHGADFIYNRTWNGHETLSAAGPTRVNLFIFVLGSGDIPTVHYEYWTSTDNPSRATIPFQSSNQIKQSENSPKHLQIPKDTKPVHNHVHEGQPTKSKAIPVTKAQGYKSYYHRNEILKSVPSWSMKRHRNYKNSINRDFHTQNDITPSTSTEYSQYSTRYGRLNLHMNYNQDQKYAVRVIYSNPTTTMASDKKENLESKVPVVKQFGRPNVTAAFTAPADSLSKRIRSYSVTEQKNSSERNQQKKRQKSGSETRRSSLRRTSSAPDSCPPCSKNRHQKKSFCESEFVLRAVVLTSEKQQHSVRYEMEVTQSFKNKVPISSREYIWTTDLCRCPKLHLGKEYIIMGRSGIAGNKRESRLLIDQKSFVRQYKQRRAKNMQRLVRDQNTLCKKFKNDF